MYNEIYSKGSDSIGACKISMGTSEEKLNRRFTGEITDTLIDAKTGEIINTFKSHNLIVDSCSVLIAGLFKNHFNIGIKYLAYGHGSDEWIDENLPVPKNEDTKLLSEFFRKEITPDMVTFIDGEDNPTEEITNRIQIRILLEANEGNGSLREFGLFGGNSATSELNSGILINRKIHGHIYKTSGMLLERIIRLTF